MTIELSPYFKPQKVSGEYSRKAGTFTIAFDYIDDEPSGRPTSFNDGVIVKEGMYSGKLLSIVIPIDKPPLDQVRVIDVATAEVRDKALAALAARGRGLVNQIDKTLNQSVAAAVIENDLGELVEN